MSGLRTSAGAAVAEATLARLRCLDCHAGGLLSEARGERLRCAACGASFPVNGGVPSLLRGGADSQPWNPWDLDQVQKMGDSYYKRAKGELPEKEASKSFASFLARTGIYRPGASILDLGAATGHFVRSFRRLLDDEVDYTGLDITARYLAWGAEIFGTGARTAFVHADVLDMPFVDDAYDIVAVNLFHFFPRIDAALGEAMRVARKWVVWRQPIGPCNYAVKVIYDQDFDRVGVITPEREDFDFSLYMIYSRPYLEGLVRHLGGRIDRFERDTDFAPFDNTALAEFDGVPATKVVGDMQINGALVLDWHYLAIACPGKE